MDKKKCVLLTNIPTPYRNPFYKNLSQVLIEKNLEFEVLFDSKSESNRNWNLDMKEPGFKYTYLLGFTIEFNRFRRDISLSDKRFLQLRFSIFNLIKIRPDIVVVGEFGLRTLQGLIYCKLFNKKIILWSEGTEHTEGFVRGVKSTLRKFLVPRMDLFWTNGSESTQLVVRYGAMPSRCFENMTGIDTSLFVKSTRYHLEKREALRHSIGVQGCTFIYVGGLIERKGIRQFLQALTDLYNKIDTGWSVVFVGSGELSADILDLMKELDGIPIHIAGNVDNNELPRFFALSDVFVMPTLDDNWPLAPLEAMCSGLPNIASIYNGGAIDLIKNNSDGVIIDPLNREDFLRALVSFVDSDNVRISDERIKNLASIYSPEKMAERAAKTIMDILNEN